MLKCPVPDDKAHAHPYNPATYRQNETLASLQYRMTYHPNMHHHECHSNRLYVHKNKKNNIGKTQTERLEAFRYKGPFTGKGVQSLNLLHHGKTNC